MNSGPTGSMTTTSRIRSIAARVVSSTFQPRSSPTGASRAGHRAERLQLGHAEVADPDGANDPPLEQAHQHRRRTLDRHHGIGPVHLVDVDVAGAQPAEGGFDLRLDTVR